MLRILGHYFGVQGKVAGKDRTPDYAFFPDQESQDQAEAHPGEDYYYEVDLPALLAAGDMENFKYFHLWAEEPHGRAA